ncbi:PKD-like family lipoprotein [Robertkochia solimangrovi]|uniref:PKD-like family lipoprotein n=1 Tax=Robertkochia solimangrovi TaxID=2213046 RepID=UPI00117FCF00|nr:PKD-like family lipoprotein [Robertkochia solimangrovi]TRZ45188.1 hypothetical protein DMZ48_05415 [Robertkochia solimangrovi]
MKKSIIYRSLFIIVGFLSVACFNDESSLDVNEIPTVVIDTTGIGSLSVYQFENLKVAPEIAYEGISEDDLDYSWKINLEPNDTLYQIIGTEATLDYPIEFKPTSSNYAHQLVLTVTNKANGIASLMAWPVKVLNNIGEGLVIAETSDGVNTDISHIMAPEFTPDLTENSVKHHVYSALNGTTLAGIIKQMRFARVYGEDAIYAISDADLYRINTFDYTFGGSNDDLFYAAKDSYSPDAILGVYQGDMYIDSGRLTSTYLGASSRYGLPFSSDYQVPGKIAANPISNPAVVITFYEQESGQFIYQPSITQFGDNTMYPIPAITNGNFDPANVPDRVILAADVNTDGGFMHLLKDQNSGKVELYTFDGGESNYPSPYPPNPLGYFDLSEAPGISEAEHFAFLNDQDILYYASGDKVYAIIYSSSTPVIAERYSVPDGAEITTLQVYRQADYPWRSGSYLALNNKSLILSSYDGVEGEVYLLPLINTGVGNVDLPNVKTFSGFDRITAITTQL